MSQQTQISRVLVYYDRWLKALPNFESLAKIDTKTLLGLWSGLGYNSRALRLRELAKIVVKNHGGLLPDDYDELIKLPGIGDYTASAVLAFAFNKKVPVLDTNVRRVLIHEFDLPEKTSIKDLQELAYSCVPQGKHKLWHHALMDYGALHKTARATGIKPLSKQGKFEGSDRQVRGFITRELTTKDKLSLSFVQRQFPKKDVGGIVSKMVRDGILKENSRSIVLA